MKLAVYEEVVFKSRNCFKNLAWITANGDFLFNCITTTNKTTDNIYVSKTTLY